MYIEIAMTIPIYFILYRQRNSMYLIVNVSWKNNPAMDYAEWILKGRLKSSLQIILKYIKLKKDDKIKKINSTILSDN